MARSRLGVERRPFGQLALMRLNPNLAEEQTDFFTEHALPSGMIPERMFNTLVATDTIPPQLLASGKRVELVSWNAACFIDLFLRRYQMDDGLK